MKRTPDVHLTDQQFTLWRLLCGMTPKEKSEWAGVFTKRLAIIKSSGKKRRELISKFSTTYAMHRLMGILWHTRKERLRPDGTILIGSEIIQFPQSRIDEQAELDRLAGVSP